MDDSAESQDGTNRDDDRSDENSTPSQISRDREPVGLINVCGKSKKKRKEIAKMNAVRDHTVRVCQWCSETFRYEKNYNKHVVGCGGSRFSKSKIERASEIAMRLVYQGDTSRGAVYTANGNNPYLAEMSTDDVVLNRKLLQGWATRPVSGKVLGANTTEKYLGLIKRWFEEGYNDKTKRRSPAMMLRMLTAMFPNNYDLPTEQHLKNRINSLLRAQRKLEKTQEEAGSLGMNNLVAQSPSVEERNPGSSNMNRNPKSGLNLSQVMSKAGISANRSIDDANSLHVVSRECDHNRTEDPVTGTQVDDVVQSNVGATTLIEAHEYAAASVVGQNSGNVDTVSAEIQPKKRGRKPNSKPMNPTYSDGILAILVGNPDVRRCEVYDLLISHLGLDVRTLPNDFPTKEQVYTKFSNFKRSSSGPTAKKRKRTK